MKSYNARETDQLAVFTAETGNIVSPKIYVKHNDELVIMVAVDSGTDGTLKFRASSDPNADLSAASSLTNNWIYASFDDLDLIIAIAGSTGYSPAAPVAVINKHFRLNEGSHYHQIALEISGRTAGSYSAKVKGVNKYGS